MYRLLVLLLLLPATLFSHETLSRPGREEIRLHLFGGPALALQTDTTVTAAAATAASAGSSDAAAERKKPGLAVLYSLLLPGMGEMYAESSSGTYFLIAEGVLWLTYAAFDVRGNSLQDDARSFAQVYAGVSAAGKNDQFYVDIGNFFSMDSYNDKKLRDREPDRLYSAAEGYAWEWRSEQDRLLYRDQRVSADQWLNNRKFVGAAILLNHVASAINAARAAIRYNDSLEDPLGDLEIGTRLMGTPSLPRGAGITLSKPLW